MIFIWFSYNLRNQDFENTEEYRKAYSKGESSKGGSSGKNKGDASTSYDKPPASGYIQR